KPLGRGREFPRTGVVEEKKWRQDRAQVRVGEERPHGEAVTHRWRSALRWMQRSFFSCLSSPFDAISALAFGAAAPRRGIHVTGERRREEGVENALDAGGDGFVETRCVRRGQRPVVGVLRLVRLLGAVYLPHVCAPMRLLQHGGARIIAPRASGA